MPLAFAFYPTTYTNHPQPKRTIVKLNINRQEIAIQILKTIWPVLAGALTGTTISLRQCRHHDEQQTRRKGIQAQLGPVGGVIGEEKRHQQAFGKSDDIPLRAAIRQIAARIRLIARSESAADGHVQHLTPGVGGAVKRF